MNEKPLMLLMNPSWTYVRASLHPTWTLHPLRLSEDYPLFPAFCPALPTLSNVFVPPCPCSPAQFLVPSNITLYNLHLPNPPPSLSEARISPSFICITLALESIKKLSVWTGFSFMFYWATFFTATKSSFVLISSNKMLRECSHISKQVPVIYRIKCNPLSLAFEASQSLTVWIFPPLTRDNIDLLLSESF